MELSLVHLAMIPVTVGVVGAFKLIRGFKRSYSAVFALAIGVLLSALYGGGVYEVVVGGLVVGLSAAGLYSGTSAVKNA